ncbi:MAG: AraC family transcriptional regulator [Lachnospiraceae bacterium]|nr:AraC family transcriptional regulator [Lachnospiraceae bacterium]
MRETPFYSAEDDSLDIHSYTDSVEQTKELLITNYNLEEINPVSAGYEKCAPNHYFGPWIRNHYIFHYVQSGKGYFIREKEQYSLKPGDVFLIRPSELCKYYADAKEPWCYIWIGFTGKRAEEFLASTIFKNNCCVAHAPHTKYLFSEIQNARYAHISLGFFLLSKIYELFLLLNDKKTENEYVEQALHYISTHYMEDITVEKIAKLLNIDRRHLGRLFLAQTGITPKEYLINVRLQNAANLLRNTSYSAAEVSRLVGYSDYCSFFKIFKKRYGVTPSDFN